VHFFEGPGTGLESHGEWAAGRARYVLAMGTVAHTDPAMLLLRAPEGRGPEVVLDLRRGERGGVAPIGPWAVLLACMVWRT